MSFLMVLRDVRLIHRALSAGFAARSAHRTHVMNRSVKNTVHFISNCFFSFYATAFMQVINSTNRSEQGEVAPFSKNATKMKINQVNVLFFAQCLMIECQLNLHSATARAYKPCQDL